MKIRSGDPSANLPPEPEKVQKKKPPDLPVEEAPSSDVRQTRAKDASAISSEVLASLGKIQDKGELGRKFADLALDDFRGSLPADVLERVKNMLAGQISEDPYIQEKLERISSLLERAR